MNKILSLFSKEYIAALVIVIVGALKIFGIEVESELIDGAITGILAIIIAVSRFNKGDITLGGIKKS